ncbi:MAG: hypothetical protein KF812_02190 [Fimbriimonadaceae bacterium]|nr:hypothetical protein [Fimbriimonadaceae bacterium]
MSALPSMIADARLLVDREGRLQASNARAAALLDLQENALGVPLVDLIPGSERAPLLSWWASEDASITLNLDTGSVHVSREIQPSGFWELTLKEITDSLTRSGAKEPVSTSEISDSLASGALPLWITTVLAADTRPEVFALVKSLGPVLGAPGGCLFLLDGSKLVPSAEWGGVVAARDHELSVSDSWSLRMGGSIDSRTLPSGVSSRHVVTAHDEFTFCTPIAAQGQVLGVLTTRYRMNPGIDSESEAAQRAIAAVLAQVLVRISE